MGVSPRAAWSAVKEWMRDPAFKTEYNALEKEYALIKEMLQEHASMLD